MPAIESYGLTRQDLIKTFREKEMGGRLLQASTSSAPTAPEV